MRRTGIALVVCSSLVTVSANATEPDVFMRAVGFALTGSDDADPRAIDRANCIFELKDEIFRLNNIHTDRIEIQGREQKSAYGTRRWVTVSLHGDEVVYETTRKPMTDDGSKFMQELKQSMPELFKPHREVSKEHQLQLETGDQNRVARAWTYIYSHGCAGKKSPF
jgi:hypothetical protein